MAWQRRSWVILPATAAASHRTGLRSPCSPTSSTEAGRRRHAAVRRWAGTPTRAPQLNTRRRLCSSFLLRAEPARRLFFSLAGTYCVLAYLHIA